jgi:hypothetical protein
LQLDSLPFGRVLVLAAVAVVVTGVAEARASSPLEAPGNTALLLKPVCWLEATRLLVEAPIDAS